MAGARVITSNELPPKAPDSPPDSTEPHGVCPRCGRLSNFSLRATPPVTFDPNIRRSNSDESAAVQRVAVLECHGCRQCVVVVEDMHIGGIPVREKRINGALQWRGVHCWPTPGSQLGEDIPEAVADAVNEGTRCLAVNAPRAAATMFRAALAEIVTDKGSEAAKNHKNLFKQLEQMTSDGHLDATLTEWAAEIRVVGNAGAHPNELERVALDEATDLSRLLIALLDYLYVMPAKVRRSRRR